MRSLSLFVLYVCVCFSSSLSSLLASTASSGGGATECDVCVCVCVCVGATATKHGKVLPKDGRKKITGERAAALPNEVRLTLSHMCNFASIATFRPLYVCMNFVGLH